MREFMMIVEGAYTFPWKMPQELRDIILSWPVSTKSPYSHSYYDVAEGQKSWTNTPLNSHRVSNHWNFTSHGQVNCPTDIPVPNDTVWALGQWDGERYVILKQLPCVRLTDVPDNEARRLQPRLQKQRLKNIENRDRKAQHLDSLTEGRVEQIAAWSGATITVYHNPSRMVFARISEKPLRGLLSPDGRDVWLWDAHMAIHSNVMQELGMGDSMTCISYVKHSGFRAQWSGAVWNGWDLLPAIERLTPEVSAARRAKEREGDEDLLAALMTDDPHGLLDESYLDGGRAPLYHWTNPESARYILEAGKITASLFGVGQVCTTRDKNFAFKKSPVRIEIDGTKVRHNRRVAPFDFSTMKHAWATDVKARHEREERIKGDVPVSAITAITIFDNGVILTDTYWKKQTQTLIDHAKRLGIPLTIEKQPVLAENVKTPAIEVKHAGGGMFVATIDDLYAGKLGLSTKTDLVGPDEVCVDWVAVERSLQRKGVATALYDAAEAYVETMGKRLVPSPNLSPVGEKLWAGRRRMNENAKPWLDHGDEDTEYDDWEPAHGINNLVRTEFSTGGCGYLALAIHEKTGWPMVAEMSPDNDVDHVWCLNGSGMAVDVNGVHPEAFAMTKYHEPTWAGNIGQPAPKRGRVAPMSTAVQQRECTDEMMMSWARELVQLFPQHFGIKV